MLHTQLRLIRVRSLSPPFLLWFTPAWQQPSSKLIHTGRSSLLSLELCMAPGVTLSLSDRWNGSRDCGLIISHWTHTLWPKLTFHTTHRFFFFKFRNLWKYLYPSSQNIVSLRYDHPEVITLRLTRSRLELKIKAEIPWNRNLLRSRRTPVVPDNGYNTNTKSYTK